MDEVEAAPPGSVLEKTREHHPPIDDVVEVAAWWRRFEEAPAAASLVAPYRASPKVCRNEACPCGSGKKYKKCCGG